MNIRIPSMISAIMLAFAPTASHAVDIDKTLALTSYSAFKCHVYAAQSQQFDESTRLFQLGYSRGTKFLEILEDGVYASEVVNQTVPGVMMSIIQEGLPNEEFVLGRIYELTREDAFDDVIKRTSSGLLMPSTQWRRDEGAKRARAKALYDEANCALLK